MCRPPQPYTIGVGDFVGCEFPFFYNSLFIPDDELPFFLPYFLTYFLHTEDRVPQMLAFIAMYNNVGLRGLRFHTLRLCMPQYWDFELRHTLMLCLRLHASFDVHYVSIFLSSIPPSFRVSPFDYGSDSDPDSDPEF